jgi:hypothetical protein
VRKINSVVKGVNKKNNVINKDKYLDVLLSKCSGSGVNRGFRVVNNTMCTYLQEKNALIIIIIFINRKLSHQPDFQKGPGDKLIIYMITYCSIG